MDDLVTIQVLASGSSGNALFIRVGETRVLVDAGISLRGLESGLAGIGEDVDRLDALLLTHEHSDHVRGLERMLRAYPSTTVLATRGTREALDFDLPDVASWTPIEAGRIWGVGDVQFDIFETVHDAAEPIGFRLTSPAFSLGFATDLGFWTDEVADALMGCRVLLVESNYDAQMLQNGPYPRFLKRRISSSKGHLSNDQAGALLRRVAHDELESVVLTHLSEKNNDPDLAVRQAARSLGRDHVKVVAARRKEPSDVLTFDGRETTVRRGDEPRQGLLF
ncbi:MAG: MBL fold metallo-hydrolase [Myxococcota bacterium]